MTLLEIFKEDGGLNEQLLLGDNYSVATYVLEGIIPQVAVDFLHWVISHPVYVYRENNQWVHVSENELYTTKEIFNEFLKTYDK